MQQKLAAASAAIQAKKQAALLKQQQKAKAALAASEPKQAEASVPAAASSKHPHHGTDSAAQGHPPNNPNADHAAKNSPPSTFNFEHSLPEQVPARPLQHKQDPNFTAPSLLGAQTPSASAQSVSSEQSAKPTGGSEQHQAKNRQTVCSSGSWDLDAQRCSIAKRRASHAGLAMAASQSNFDAILSNPPQVLSCPQLTQQEVHNSGPTLPHELLKGQSDQQLPPPPVQQEPMTRSALDPGFDSMPNHDGRWLSPEQDTAAPMDIDTACTTCHPSTAEPFGQVPVSAFGQLSGASQGANSFGPATNNAAQHHVHKTTPIDQSISDHEPDLMDIDVLMNLC